ncbi:MAG: portal protein [Clostridiales bacterium]|nr:portal protein [Clostridiales bacterium]
MKIYEALKSAFTRDDIMMKSPSNDTEIMHRTKTLTNDPFGGAMVLSQLEDQDYNYGFGQGQDVQSFQNSLIERYRELASDSEVSNGVDTIINEMIYTIDDLLKIDIDEENDKIKDTISKTFRDVLSLININDNIFNICRQMYIDGQLNVSLVYKKGKVQEGIQQAHILEPQGLFYDKSQKLWQYQEEQLSESLYSTTDKENETYTESELVHVDYGLYTKFVDENKLSYQVNLSYLEGVFKNANMLQTLENMLVPLRYSRSVSRRLFNIDVADLPPKSAKELMDKIRSEFRYKKTYDPRTGTIKNIKATQPMVEDYWMSNRGGAKGTTVDTMDEKGGLMDMEDIKYTANKLYSSMKIPSSRNPYSDEQASFSFDDTSIEQEELSFFIFVSRLRVPVTKLIKEIMRRQLVAIGTFTDKEWKGFEKKITISFGNEAIFLENMKKELFIKNTEAFTNVKEMIGETISLQTAVKNTFGWSTDQLDDELELMLKERENTLYRAFYSRDEEGDNDPWGG